MSEQEPFPDSESDLPRDMTPDELDQALRWLEDLAGKQGKSLEGLISLDETSLEDSPFKGLFDSEEQELPDWLREVPKIDDFGNDLLGDDQIEGESRLDWLARMASRESVEELPTLEWRRLTEGEDEDGDLVDAMPDAAAAIAGLPEVGASESDLLPSELMSEQAVFEQPTATDLDVETPAVVELMTAMAEAEAAAAIVYSEPEVEPETTIPPFEPEAAAEMTEAPPAEIEAAGEPAESDIVGDPGFSADDLDEAMAWLEELAASQDAPIEDLPSVADRALASKLMAEAASGVSQGEGRDVSQLGIALSGIYVGETKLGPTGPLVGEAPADETPDSAIHAEVILATEAGSVGEESDLASGIEVTSAETTDAQLVDEPLVEEAVAEEPATSEELMDETLSDELFVVDEIDENVVDEHTVVEEYTIDETAGYSPLAEELAAVGGFVSTEEFVTTGENASVYEEPSLAALMTSDTKPLPELLAFVDRLAVPGGLSLTEIDALLAADQMTVKIMPFSLDSTLDWLEDVVAGRPGVDPLDLSLVAAMPDDPDEAQAYLEQLSGMDDVALMAATSATVSQAASSLDLTEADLLDMPDDPDAAIAWIENLAAQRERNRT